MFPDSFQSLNLEKLSCVWSAYWRIWVVRIRIKLKQDSWLQSKIAPMQSTSPTDSEENESTVKLSTQELHELHESVRLAARCHFGEVACLPRALVLADILKSRGVWADVVVGVNKASANLASHAWVECEGFPIGEPENVEEEFARLGFRNKG